MFINDAKVFINDSGMFIVGDIEPVFYRGEVYFINKRNFSIAKYFLKNMNWEHIMEIRNANGNSYYVENNTHDMLVNLVMDLNPSLTSPRDRIDISNSISLIELDYKDIFNDI